MEFFETILFNVVMIVVFILVTIAFLIALFYMTLDFLVGIKKLLKKLNDEEI